MTTEQLKPCPFCGKQPTPPKRNGGSNEQNGYNFVMRVSCQCGATIGRDSRKDARGWCNDEGQAERDVVLAWNARA